MNDAGAVGGQYMSSTLVIEFNEFANQVGNTQDLPYAPTLDLYAKLTTEDFHWAVEFVNDTSQYFVVCQFR